MRHEARRRRVIRHPWLARVRDRRARDEGMTIIEVMAALAVLSVAAVGLAASVGLGFRTVALGRQRQTAIELASAKVERARNVPYDSLGIDAQPVYSSDPTSPEHFVSSDGTSYDPTGTGTYEPLIVTPGAGILHYDDPVLVGKTTMEVYQYVTWVDDPSISGTEDYKRLTVVIRYKAPAINGTLKIARVSSLFTPDGITFPNTTTTTSPFPTTTTSSSTTTTTAPPGGGCEGDTTAPTGSFTVPASNGATAGYTPTQSVTLSLSFTDDCSPLAAYASFSNDGGVTWGSEVQYDPANPTVSWALSAGDGLKTIDGRVRDASGNYRSLTPQNVVLDTIKPTTPGSLTRTVSCSGTNRTVTLQWGSSTDTNLLGYRLYRSTDNVNWSVVATTSSLTATDTHDKTLTSVRYRAVAYDRAGNESDATNIVSLSKNQCS